MDKSKQTQIEKYGGEEGYKAEMRRRRKLRKDYSTGGFAHYKLTGQTDKIIEASKKSAEKRRKK